MPFNGMLTSDAWLWSKYRDDKKLMTRLLEVTETAVYQRTWILWYDWESKCHKKHQKHQGCLRR